MAKKFLVNLDLTQNELQNAVIEKRSAAPTSPVKGQVYYDTGLNKFRIWNGEAWDTMGADGVKEIKVEGTNDSGLSISGSPITTRGTINIGHQNVLDQAQNTKAIYPITIDKNGHISSYGNAFNPSDKQDALNENQMAAVNSGINNTKVAQIETNKNNIATLQTAVEGKQDTLNETQMAAVNSGATAAKITQIETNQEDIVDLQTSVAGKQDTITDLETIRTGAALGATALQTETDPVFRQSVAANITQADIDSWNAKQGNLEGGNAIDISSGKVNAIVKTNGGVAIDTTSNGLYVDTTKLSYNDLQDKIVFEGSYDASTNKATTKSYVDEAIAAIPKAMQFKGTLGQGGTITELPTAAEENKGFTYKVITAGTYAGIVAKVGDMFISNGTAWTLIPSGDEPSGTVTNVTAGIGLTTDDGQPITSSGTIKLAEVEGLTAGTYNTITVDKYGRVISGNYEITKTMIATITGDGVRTSFTIAQPVDATSIANIAVYDNEEEVITETSSSGVNITITFGHPVVSGKSYTVKVVYKVQE